ncbi:MAG: hypothetical protein KIT83_07810 [Bryobacterales bacterium]|nr:hypothetical protein [Bryobacterales bacterium]
MTGEGADLTAEETEMVLLPEAVNEQAQMGACPLDASRLLLAFLGSKPAAFDALAPSACFNCRALTQLNVIRYRWPVRGVRRAAVTGSSVARISRFESNVTETLTWGVEPDRTWTHLGIESPDGDIMATFGH